MLGQQPTQNAQAIAIKVVTVPVQNNMYIELTTFAIPTFLITCFKVAAIVVGVWLAICIIFTIIYHRGI
jgi:hypothetical protein